MKPQRFFFLASLLVAGTTIAVANGLRYAHAENIRGEA